MHLIMLVKVEDKPSSCREQFAIRVKELHVMEELQRMEITERDKGDELRMHGQSER